MLTIASGLRLVLIVSGGFGSAWFGTRMGFTFTVSGAAATVAFLLALFVARPSAVRATQLAASTPSITNEAERARVTAQAAGMRARAAITGNVVLALLLIGAAGMSVARYLG